MAESFTFIIAVLALIIAVTNALHTADESRHLRAHYQRATSGTKTAFSNLIDQMKAAGATDAEIAQFTRGRR
jgi:hypothetical protein